MKTLIAIALGGSLGALSRYYLSKFFLNLIGGFFPWGTIIINLTGSFLIGIFFNLFDKSIISVEIKTFITIGFLGAFTTFSTFALENLNLLRDGEIKIVLLNILISNIFGILSAFIGFYIIELIFNFRR